VTRPSRGFAMVDRLAGFALALLGTIAANAAPTGMALLEDGHLLVPLDDPPALAVVLLNKTPEQVARRPLDFRPGTILALSPNEVLISDPDGGRVRRFSFAADPLSFQPETDIEGPWRQPYHLALSTNLSQLGVSSRDHRELHLVALPEPATAATTRSSSQLAFGTFDEETLIAPHPDRHRLQLRVPSTDTVKTIPLNGMQIDSLVWAGQHGNPRLHLTGTRLNPLATTAFGDLHWGNLVMPLIQTVIDGSIAEDRLGKIREPGTDPAGIVELGTNHFAVALGGIDELALVTVSEDGSRIDMMRRCPTGPRPQQVLFDPTENRLVVANHLNDSISVITLGQVDVRHIRLGSNRADSAVERGRRLFFSAKLSHDKWLSCHTCHRDTGGLDQLIDTLADGHYGSPKRIPDLRGVADTAPFGWTGSKPDLETQIRDTLNTTMQVPGNIDEQQVADLAAFLRSLPPAPDAARENRVTDSDAAQADIAAGKALFGTHRCDRCHKAPAFTSALTVDIGLLDERGNQKFNPPSLRGLRFRHRLLHDGRADSLTSLLKDHQHQLDEALSEQELRQLLRYLQSL